ncbi:hypothetical protein Xoosp13_8 [Xanthomonas phage Xoo-sp13]|nr:hypothetical protein Xoosp13_8 [Xanthomonas phage Xoo-sp13]
MLPWDAQYDTVGLDTNSARLQIFIDNVDSTKPYDLVYSCPVIGPEYKAMPLVMQLAIELLIRKTCNGSDPE